MSLRVLFRQNTSWHGSVAWVEGKCEESFRSVLELLIKELMKELSLLQRMPVVQHFLIWEEIKKESRRIGLPEDKPPPESLYGTYLETYANLCAESVEDINKRDLDFFREEETVVGWNEADMTLSEEKESTGLADTLVKRYGNPFDKLSREEDCVIKRLGEALSDILSRKYDCTITITYTRKEDA